MQNILSSAQASLASPTAAADAPWYIKYGARGAGTIAGGMAMFMGALSTITSIFTPLCIVLSIWQIVCGFLVLTIESPCCCFFIDHVQTISQKIDSKPLLFKAGAYIVAPLPVMIWCFGFPTFFGSGLIMGVGVMYGFMAVGKKADRSEMAAAASGFTLFGGPGVGGGTGSSNNINVSDKKNLVVEQEQQQQQQQQQNNVWNSFGNGHGQGDISNTNPPPYAYTFTTSQPTLNVMGTPPTSQKNNHQVLTISGGGAGGSGTMNDEFPTYWTDTKSVSGPPRPNPNNDFNNSYNPFQ